MNIRYAVRSLARSPLFAAAAILSLALGIGVNTGIFSLFDQVLLRLLPVRDPSRLVLLTTEYQAPGWMSADSQYYTMSYPMYRDIRDRTTVFSGVVARASAPSNFAFDGGDTERLRVEIVTGNFFDVLGVKPALGRMLTSDDDRTRDGHPVAVLSYAFWMRHFGGSADVLNRKILLNGSPVQVVGVAARTFRGVLAGSTPGVFVPMAMSGRFIQLPNAMDDRRGRWVNILARIRPGVSAAQAAAETRTLYKSILREELAQIRPLRSPAAEREFLNHYLEVLPAGQGLNQMRRSFETPLAALMALAGLVLLIACANVAGLLAARAAARRKEFAIRVAIGAGRMAIARQLLAEGLVLSLAGGAAGLIIARWTTEALVRGLESGSESWLRPDLDLRVLGFALLVSCITGVLFGLAPLFDAARPSLAPVLKGQSSREGWRRGQGRLRRGLIAVQVALSLVLLIGSGLFARTLGNLRSIDPGFRPESLLTFTIDPRLNGYDIERGSVFYERLRESLEAIPGVGSAGGAFPGPLSNNDRAANVTIEGYHAKGDADTNARIRTASPGYFRTVGMQMIAGREFTLKDATTGPKAVVVNEAFVKQYFANENPLGRHITFGAGSSVVPDREIVGVVRDSKHGSLREDAAPSVFYPAAQDSALTPLDFYVRSSRPQGELAAAIRRAVRELDRGIPVVDIKPMTVVVDESIYTERMMAMLATAFGALATLLAALGLYGVIAYTVERRTAEIGIRMALGGSPRDALRAVLRDGLRTVIVGLAIGLPAALALARLVQSQLFGLKPYDPVVVAGAIIVLIAAAVAACFIPARRAARVDPIVALRYE